MVEMLTYLVTDEIMNADDAYFLLQYETCACNGHVASLDTSNRHNGPHFTLDDSVDRATHDASFSEKEDDI